MSGKREELCGVYAGQKFINDNRFIIGFLESGESVLGVLGDQDLIPGIDYRFIGRWEEKPGYGRQFKFDAFLQNEPHTRHGIVQYLKKFAPGVGDVTAHKLCDLYGENQCLAVLKRDPAKVAEAIPTLRNGKAEAAAAELIKQEKFQETRIDLMDLFSGRGFPGTLIDACIARWGIHAAKRVRKDPFCLLTEDMPGCGFVRVDRLYLELGNEPDRITRRVICAWYAVHEDRTGSVWVKWSDVKSGMEKLISNCSRIDVAIDIAVGAGWLARECMDGEVYLAETSQADYENYIAQRLQVLA